MNDASNIIKKSWEINAGERENKGNGDDFETTISKKRAF